MEMEQKQINMFLENDEEDTSVTQKSWRNISTPPLFLKDVKWRIWEMKKGPSEGDDLWHIVCRIQVIVDYGKKPQPWRTILQAYNLSVDMNLNLYHLQWMNIVQTNLGRSWHTIRMLEHLWNGIGNRKAKKWSHHYIFFFYKSRGTVDCPRQPRSFDPSYRFALTFVW